ncbi:FadR/GntR family transcriptional regulator [Verminephrobacter eiseniae]|uniref:FadR/GntR family transcriptional regulator n=1 Tax=Verminephrobacter eiseniae TaxID=364317 RepID=UPI002238AB3A|nr:FCD domain-containing protein [Verminephrobacter eiseniae]
MESLPSGFELPIKSNHPGRQDDENTGASPEKIDGTEEPRLRWHFHPIANARAHEDVVEQIIFSILSGAYSADDRLPSVEQLAQAMNVSKPVIGEALKVLIKAKIVRVQRGRSGGLFVLTNNVPDSVLALTAQLRHVSLSEIIEARHPVELQLALLAAERATQADFAALRSCIDQLRGHRHSDLSIRIRYDHMFHYTLGRIARSSALALFQHQILEQIFLRMPDYFLYEENPDTVITLHEGTLAAIRSRSPEKIRAAIAEHMSALENVVTSSGGRPRSSNKP